MRLIIALFFVTAYTFAITGLELAELLESREKPNDIKSINTMTLTNKDGKTKILELVSMSKDDSEKQMIWFLKPKKDKGIAFLKIEHDDDDDFMTMWLPGFSRFKRIKSSQKSDSFMGSDLSFEDLSNRTISDYNYKIIEVDENNNGLFYLESIPKEVDSEYSKHITKIQEVEIGIFIVIEESSYDKNNELLKTKIFNFKKIDSYYVMDRLKVENVQKNHSTLLTVNEILLNNNFEDSKFSQRSLKIIPK
mgnify:CR=1 FL=1